MNNNQSSIRIAGVLYLVQFIIGILINQFLLGPFTFAEHYMTSVAAHSPQIIVSMLLSIVNEIISITTAVLLFPVFKKQHEKLAIAFLMFSAAGFMAVTADNVNIQALLTVSREYVKAGAASTAYFQTLGATAYATRLWTHLMILLVACLPFSVFYYLLFKYKFLPRFISVWGLVGTAAMLAAVLLEIFDTGSFMLLYAPIGLNQLLLSFWMMLKGFKLPPGKDAV